MYVFWRKTFFWKIYTFFLYYKFMYCATGFQVGYKQDNMIKNCPSVTKLVMFIYHFFLHGSFFQRHQVTFSHWNLSVVCHLCCCPFALLLLWTFHIFSRTIRPISTKLGTKLTWMKGIQVCSNEWPHPFPRVDNNEIVKIHSFDEI